MERSRSTGRCGSRRRHRGRFSSSSRSRLQHGLLSIIDDEPVQDSFDPPVTTQSRDFSPGLRRQRAQDVARVSK